MNIKKFTKREKIGLCVIFIALLVISIPNFVVSIKRARDNARKDDLGSIVYALNLYQKDFRSYPLSSSDNKILACTREGVVPEKDEKGNFMIDFVPCQWGKDGMYDPRFGDKSNPYINLIPQDPDTDQGVNYLYFSNGRHIQIYTALEVTDDDQFNPDVFKRNLNCGTRICNTGRSDGKTPLDKSIEEYENELNGK